MPGFDVVRWIKSRYRALIVAGGLGLVIGMTHYMVWPRKYAATAALLVMQAESKPVHVANETPNSIQEKDDYVATQSGIITSPLIMQRALTSVGLEHCPSLVYKLEPVDAALSSFKVSRPDRNAKILSLEYRAGSRLEAEQVLNAVVSSYTNYVAQDLYRGAQDRIITLIQSKQGAIKLELSDLEAQYLSFVRAHPGLTVAKQGHSANSERLTRWGVAISDAELRQIRVAAQLSMAKSLIEHGIKTWGIAYAVGQLGDSGELLRSVDVRAMQFGGNDFLRGLIAEQSKLVDELGADSSKALLLQNKIQTIQDRATPLNNAESNDIVTSMQQVLDRLIEIRKNYDAHYNTDLQAFNNDEVALLQEESLKARMDRARTMYNSLLDSLKQAQLNSEYNAITASILEAPHVSAKAVSPKLLYSMAFGLLFGLIGGVVYLERSSISRGVLGSRTGG